jgi:hypothetical protein
VFRDSPAGEANRMDTTVVIISGIAILIVALLALRALGSRRH